LEQFEICKNEIKDQFRGNTRFVKNHFDQNHFEQNPFVKNPFVKNKFIKNYFIKKCKGIKERTKGWLAVRLD
jgi:hypothetical protein